MHVFISGAGPVGLSAGISLLSRGHTVTIVDRDEGITHESRAVAVNHNSLKLLEPSGVSQKLVETGAVIRHIRVLEDGKPMTRLRVPGQDRRWPTLVGLPQSSTEGFMEARFNQLGGAVIWNNELVDIKEEGGAVQATFADRASGARQEVTADYALGADGSRSKTRETLGIAFDGRTMPENWSLGDVHCDWAWPDDEACVNLSRDHGVLFMITLGNGRYRLISNQPDAIGQAKTLMPIGEVVWSNPFNVHLRVAETLVKGRVALAGDAAHTHSPVGGRGMNLGIADAFAFADAVDARNLEDYGAGRLPAARRTVDVTDRIYRFATGTTALRIALRDRALRTAGSLTQMFG